MTRFTYKAKSGPHKIVDGLLEAPTHSGAIRQVLAMGLTPLEVAEAAEISPPKEGRVLRAYKNIKLLSVPSRALSSHEIAFFTRQMSDLVEAAVPLLRSLQIVERQARHAALKNIIHQMSVLVQNGGSLSGALAQHPSVFPAFYVNMVRTGEVGGRLPNVLARLAEHLEKEQEIRSKIRSSLAYPLLILATGILTVFVLLTFVIPRLSVMFEDLEQALPLPTVILVNISGFFSRYWWLLAAVFVIIKIYWQRWVRSPQGRLRWDAAKLKMPFLGEFIRTVEIGRFVRTLATLLESGVTVTAALEALEPTIDNAILREEIKKTAKAVTDGLSLKSALGQSSFFPEMVTSMVAVGEESGRLEKGLYKIAETLERQADQTVKVIMALLGPAVLIVIVSLVGFAVIAMLLPILRMNLLIQ